MINQEEIHNQFFSEDPIERIQALKQLEYIFSLFPDKQQAWNNLHNLTTDKDSFVRFNATSALGSTFPHVPDKQQAWNDLIRLTTDKDSLVKYSAASALGSVFSDVPDKQQAWNDLIGLTTDKDIVVRCYVASALGSVFSDVPDKQQAWNDLHNLTNDENSSVKYRTASVLGSVFSDVPDKQQAWNDLIRLTTDKDSYVRSNASYVLGSAFSQVPDKQQAWNNLHKLTSNKDGDVRASANHSLGKVSIFKASQSEKEEEYKKELEKAICFFEKAARESYFKRDDPSQFCLPFYRSFHSIIFKKRESKKEVDKYLGEAKDAVRGSKSKKLLLEAVENLANALKEVQNLENLDLEAKKGELNFYRKYCDRAAELMRETEETALFATIAMRKGLPILNRNLKELIEEIQKKTELISEQTKGTQFEELGNELNQNSLSLLQVRDPVGFKKQVNIMQSTMRAICSKLAEDQKGEACELLRIMYAEPAIEDKIPLMVNILSKFSYQLDMTTHLNRIEDKLDSIQEDLKGGLKKLDTLSQKVGGKEGELIKTFSKKVLELTEKGDKKALQSFLEEVLKNKNVLIEEIESSSAPLEEKEESKSSVLKIKSVLDKVKHPIKSFGKDVTKEIVVGYAADEIVKLVFQLVSMATLGVPIPPQMLNLLKM